MDIPTYHKVIDEFLSKGWDESVLNRYYRVTRPLYTTQLFIPLIGANAAPKAFGVENIVKPSFWLIHYKGQVSAPSDGEWRFWGDGEEVLQCGSRRQARAAGELERNHRALRELEVSRASRPQGGEFNIRAGDWITLKKGQVVDIDVLIGERAGGVFCAFLMIEKKGETYPQEDGHPVFPVFQLAPFDTPQPKSAKTGPPILPNGPILEGGTVKGAEAGSIEQKETKEEGGS